MLNPKVNLRVPIYVSGKHAACQILIPDRILRVCGWGKDVLVVRTEDTMIENEDILTQCLYPGLTFAYAATRHT